jgi:hypothetical protein
MLRQKTVGRILGVLLLYVATGLTDLTLFNRAIPMALFEVTLALWLIIKGVRSPEAMPARS